jgi:hypothetical protein
MDRRLGGRAVEGDTRGVLCWGQDRLDFLDEALTAEAQR